MDASDMDKILRFPDSGPEDSRLELEACDWFARVDRGNLSPDERVEFDKWLTRDPEHRAEFERARSTWKELEVLDRLTANSERRAAGPESDPSSRLSPFRGLRSYSPWVTTLASVAVIVLGAVLWARFHDRVVTRSWTFATRVGEQRTANLPDGSSVILNTASRLQVSYDDKNRDVRLLQGEVHFAVAHDTARPFFVHAGTGVVRAVGTAFTVRLREQEVDVTVTEGAVELIPAADSGRRAKVAENGSRPRVALISAGRRATINEGTDIVQPLKVEELAHELAWQQGMLSFSGDPLDVVVAEVSRYTPVKIVIVDPALQHLRIGGYFRIGETDAIFAALKSSFNVRVQHVNDHLVYLSRGPD